MPETTEGEPKAFPATVYALRTLLAKPLLFPSPPHPSRPD